MKKLSLTFDDGPNYPLTDILLNVLRRHNVPATFFPIGQREARSSSFIINGYGFEFGNHTWSHRVLLGASYEEMEREINGCGRYFRPPEGRYDARMLEYLKLHNIQLVLWDIDSFDWAIKTAAEICGVIDEQVGDGGIILFHDGDSNNPEGDRWATIEATERVITKYKDAGYEFVPLSEMELPGVPRMVSL